MDEHYPSMESDKGGGKQGQIILASKIGLLNGEKEFKKALTDINRSFQPLALKMKLVASEF